MTPAERHLGTVLRILHDAGRGPDLDELLDVLWLAGRLGGPAAELPLARAARRSGSPPAAGPEQAGDPGAPGTDDAGGPPPAGDALDRTAPELHAAPLPKPREQREQRDRPPAPAAVAADPPARDRPALPLRVPEDKALPDELRIGRALRPLKQKRPSPRRQEIDEGASAAAVAETGLPDVVMRPARERWFHLVLVVDDGLSMLLWHRLAVELRTTLQRLGAFRSIRVFGIGTRTPGPPVLRGHPFDPDSSTMSASVPTDPSGQTLILVVSDGMGAAWRRAPGPGSMHDTLLHWATSGPVAVVHALPAALWEGSGIRAERWQATTRRQGGSSTTWQITDRVLPFGLADFTGVPVPVLEPSPDAMHAWARLIMSPGTTVELPLLSRSGRHRPVAPPREAGSVQHFRDAASPGAYRLAAHLAAVSPVSIPVMRLVQSAVPWRATTAELAEVFLGGLLRPFPAPVPGPLPAQHRVFDFPEAARTALLDAVPRAELLRTGRHIGRHLEELAGRSPDFPAWLAHPDGADRLPAAYRSFTAVERRLLTRFGVTVDPPGSPDPGTPEAHWPGEHWEPLTAADPRQLGRYTLTGRRPGRRTVVYRGRGPGGELAAVCTAHPDMPYSTDQLVATQAEVLRRLDGRYAPALLATGLNDSPAWIAMQLVTVPGQDDAPPRLQHLLHTVSMDVLTSISLGWHLAGALSLCHLQGVVPAELKADSVLVLGRSLLLTGLSDAAVDGVYAGPGLLPTAAENVKSLGELLLLISSKKRETLPGLQNGMELWQGDTWRPLRVLVARCLATNPDDRPTASEAAGVLARYVAIANELAALDGQTQGVRSTRPAGVRLCGNR
ncbi:SAV_2336 N-terminal domain-related protein [Streptomyces abikoensis]